MALRPCLICGTPSEGSRCSVHALRNGSTRSWRQLRAEILYRDAYRCAICGHAASEVDHVVPHAGGGADDPSNCRSICRDCHRARH